MKLHIRNMVCNRCKMVVQSELETLGFKPLVVEMGEVTLDREISDGEKGKINEHLQQFGFALIDDKKSQLIEKVKTLIVGLVQQHNGELKTNLSDYLSLKLRHDYSTLTSLFSEVEGTTIEKYFIAQRIEKVKELLVYDEMTLSEIAYMLNYSSVAHLSNQFKKVTGLTPSHFKHIRDEKRKSLDEV
ncbi:MAG TPA: AraC family transcriptional regulator [Saprospiraceae bacterium]|nr:AraC family transcriptional regulator [Saprospiraceae bacterium]